MLILRRIIFDMGKKLHIGKDNSMKRVACYVRVSTQEQKAHGLSVDNQIVALKDYCEENGYKCAGVYNDAGISAHISYKKRPALLKLLKDCGAGKIDLVIFTKLDRWFRSVGDYYEVQRVLELAGVPWRAIWEDYETETSTGVFKVNIMLSVAQAEAERTSERIRNTFDYKRAKGDYLGTPPLGYVRRDGKLYKDEELAPLIRSAFDVFLKTHSSSAVVRYLNNNGLSCSRHRATRLLYGSAYVGDANGHKCEPYITQEEYEIIQGLRESKYREPKNNLTYLFNTLCKCGQCGYTMRAQGTTCNGKFYPQYGCNGAEGVRVHDKGIYISEKKVERYMLEALEGLVADYNSKLENKDADIEYKEMLKKKKGLEGKLERVGVRFEVGDISVEEYKNKRAAILDEIAALNFKPPKNKTVTLPDSWREIYDQLDKEHRREFWFSIVEKITINPDRSIEVKFL